MGILIAAVFWHKTYRNDHVSEYSQRESWWKTRMQHVKDNPRHYKDKRRETKIHLFSNSSSYRKISHSSQPADEQGEDENSFQELDLASSFSSRTIVDLKVSVCQTSTTSSLGRGGHIPGGIPTIGAGCVPVDENSITAEVMSLQQTHHVTEVVSTDTDVPSVATVASECSENDLSLTVEEAEYARKCASLFSPRGKSPFEAILLITCYLLVGALFFPIFVVVLMVCFVSYFTPDIDD